MLLTIIITVLVCSAVATLIYVIGGNIQTSIDSETLALICLGPICWLIVGIINLVAYIGKKTKRFRHKSMLVCPDGKVRYCDYNYADEYCGLEGYSFVDAKRFLQEGWNAKDWNSYYRMADVASTRYVPRKIWKNYEKI
jgi:hypothetical protein